MSCLELLGVPRSETLSYAQAGPGSLGFKGIDPCWASWKIGTRKVSHTHWG